jgi:hypothetical protein
VGTVTKNSIYRQGTQKLNRGWRLKREKEVVDGARARRGRRAVGSKEYVFDVGVSFV